MKQICVFCLALFLGIVLSVPIALADGTENELPGFKLPELPPLEVPSLSQNYTDLLKDLEQQGWGKYNPNESLSLPAVEKPYDADKQATEKFDEEYGDMQNSPSHQLDKTGLIPEDAYFKKFLEKYREESLNKFGNIKNKDSISMDKFLKTQLDMSGLWDFDELKNRIRFQDTSKLLANVGKPDGWNSIKKSGFAVPNMDSWLNGPKAEGYGKSSIWDTGNNMINSIFPGLDLKQKLVGGIQKARELVDDIIKKAKEEKENNGQVSKETWEKFKELAKKEFEQFIPFFHGK